MKKLIALLLALCMLTGCRLASEEKKEDRLQDKLVGVLVTFEPLDLDFDIEGYLRDNPGVLKGEEVALEPGEGLEYGQRLWAEVTEEGWSFPGIEGMVMGQMRREDHWMGFSTEGFCEHKTKVERTDTLDAIDEEGTVYFPSGSEVQLCANPVYMTPDGAYYALQGSSFHSTVDSGSMSQSVSDEKTWNVDGQETIYRAKFTTTVQGVTLAEKVVMIWMTEDHQQIAREEYVPGQLPETLTPEEGAAYLIVEETAGETVTRQLCQPGDGQITVYYQSEHPWCLPDVVNVVWDE